MVGVGKRANGQRVRGQGVRAAGHEAQKDVLARLPARFCGDGDAERMWCLAADMSGVVDAVTKVRLGKGKQQASDVERHGSDEVVPRRQAKGAVDEEEDDEDNGEEEVSGLEEFVKFVAISCQFVLG